MKRVINLDIKIIEWEDKYADEFISLSVEWLEKYLSVEPADLEILNNPHKMILDNGGMVFFAKSGNNIVGTVAVIKKNDVFELAKLSVTESYKGRKIGNMLIEKAISFAENKGTSYIYLFTNHKLVPAINLYKKYGFYEIPLIENGYIESDIKMRKDFKNKLKAEIFAKNENN